MESSAYLAINQWAEADRPREKLILKGKASLSDAELIAILLGSGTRTLSAVDLAKQILHAVNFDLYRLARLTVSDLTQYKGIGQAKAISIVSALELGRRRKENESQQAPKITGSDDVFQLIRPELADQLQEQFWILLLKRNNEVIRKECISIGGVSGTTADPKIIFKKALEVLASSIILIHNHPSGNLSPSEADIRLTRKMKEAGELLDLPILDHIIFTDHGYFSFADESML